ncbi:Uncharacterised protein [Salmonella bongori]|nr:Uncharacterised protein [Salmonella bongori]
MSGSIIKITGNIAVTGFLLRQATQSIKRLLAAQAVSAGGGDELALVVITEPYTPSVRRDNFRHIPGADIQPETRFYARQRRSVRQACPRYQIPA